MRTRFLGPTLALVLLAAPLLAYEFDADAPPDTAILVSPALRFGAALELDSVLRRDDDLDRRSPDARALLEPTLSLAATWEPADWVRGFLSLEPTAVLDLAEGREDVKNGSLEVTEAWLLFRKVLDGHAFVKLGRQRFEDPREWLADAELDAFRVFYLLGGLTFDLSVSRLDLVHRDVTDDHDSEPQTNLHARVDATLFHTIDLAAYVIERRHRRHDGESPLFVGLQSNGLLVEQHLQYWLEAAHVRGHEGSVDLRGWGVDVGTIWRPELPLDPSASIGFAYATGDDDPEDGVDHAFRQTGLQDDEAPLAGVANVRLYGEVLDPELSNLMIASASVGLRPTRTSSVDLVYHHFRQDERAPFLRDSPLTATPSGESHELGDEVDLVLGWTDDEGFEVKLAAGGFFPGRAFTRGDPAPLVRIEAQYALDGMIATLFLDDP